MAVPPFLPHGALPLGRHVCSLEEFEQAFVLDDQFASSQARGEIFGDFVWSLEYLENKFHPDLVERAWVGGGFTTAKPDPSDIDVTFLLSSEVHAGLSGTKRSKLAKILRTDGFKKQGIRVDGFMVVRERIALPWAGAGVGTDGKEYFATRGAWDDWWSRERANVAPGEDPVLEDAEPVRGYVEVII